MLHGDYLGQIIRCKITPKQSLLFERANPLNCIDYFGGIIFKSGH